MAPYKVAMDKKCICVVIPIYNEDRNIQTCLRRLWTVLEPYEHELLVCYDFDEDTTLDAIARMEDKPPTVRLVKNDLGRGAVSVRIDFVLNEELKEFPIPKLGALGLIEPYLQTLKHPAQMEDLELVFEVVVKVHGDTSSEPK